MSKKLRKQPIYIAPEIFGWLDDNNNPLVFDERSKKELDPLNEMDKIEIYERQVKDWFLNPAYSLANYRNKNKGFIVLMICLSYLEGVEQYRVGQSSSNNSRSFFVTAMNRIYPNKFSLNNLRSFYSEARCGLFHNGMVRGRIIINNGFSKPLEFKNNDIKISPKKFLNDIIQDFDSYINELKNNQQSRDLFNQLYTNI
ncbi:hypothetical protein [uncultured Winogradskyella sp.]|uniref:hypothetical protein n=1 Tax=uncultured Winogradskyella sp. TaxID=395353 RepID=UPI00262E708E|nr:hypothetical protein [uncultured Winogradskyella sp.]